MVRNAPAPLNLIVILATAMPLVSPRIETLRADTPPLQLTTQIEDGGPLGVGRQIDDQNLLTLDGRSLTASQLLKDRKALVFVMTSTGCPLSTKYAPRLASIEKLNAERVTFVYVNTVRAETRDDMRRQIREFGFTGPYLPDRDGSVAKALGARTTTEVFVIDTARTLVYRGAVDDQYGVGTARDAPAHEFLRDALKATIEGNKPSIKASWPPGCLLDTGKRREKPDKDLTYYGRISRILADHCVECHRVGGVAPFPLDSYSALTGRVSMIEAVVGNGLMPPWHGSRPAKGEQSLFANDRILSDEDRADLLRWLRSSRSLGKRADAPVLPPVSPTWEIGRPDEVFTTMWMDLPAEGPMQHARMLVPTNLKADRWASAFEIRYDMHNAIHHALVWILPPGAVVPPIENVPTSLEFLGAYSPGDGVVRFDDGTARQLPAGSLLLVDMYARPMGQTLRTRLRIGMRFADAPPKKAVRTLIAAASELEIPAGASRAKRRIEATLTGDATMTAFLPYMRARGTGITIDAVFPDGRENRILEAPRYDYRWQIRYVLKEPVTLPEGTRLIVRGIFENTAENPRNPSPGVTAHAGLEAGDEAMMLVIELVDDADSE